MVRCKYYPETKPMDYLFKFEFVNGQYCKGIYKPCDHCGKLFFVLLTNIKRGFGQYCSRNCVYRSKDKREIRTCLFCGKEFLAPNHKIMKSEAKYCYVKCKQQHLVGKNAPGWRDGNSFFPYCIKFNNTKKKEIRNKFDNKCILCGKTKEENGRYLSVYHINKLKDQGCNGHEWDLVPLCIKCHGKVHGRKNEKYYESLIRSILSWRVIQT